ncbi:hypothetical protein RIF29_05089 [Crotalaria pallida]|uniref:Uncharacterized protein n=1 Tax=Crotalaria pallida TaxID=3830 RepID=A0AAN9J478_CROPI
MRSVCVQTISHINRVIIANSPFTLLPLTLSPLSSPLLCVLSLSTNTNFLSLSLSLCHLLTLFPFAGTSIPGKNPPPLRSDRHPFPNTMFNYQSLHL